MSTGRGNSKRAWKRRIKKAKIAGAYAQYYALSRVAPRSTGKRAALLWCLLPAGSGRRKDSRPYPGTVEQVPMEGRQLTVESWGEGPLVYLQHGWGGWHGQLGALVDPLVQAGFRVVAGDALSHGSSDAGEYGPRHSTGGELTRSFQAIVAHYGRAHAVIGHSMGCAAVTRALAQGMETDRAVLIAPSPDMRIYRDIFANKIGLSHRCQRYLSSELETMARCSMADFDIAELGAGLTIPTVVFHDTKDKESPYNLSQRIGQRWPDATFVTTEGLGHQRILLDPGVIQAAVTFVRDGAVPTVAAVPAVTAAPAGSTDSHLAAANTAPA